MMVANHILSRRSLLKASSFLVVAVAAAPTAALAVPEVPEVLAMLLAEYRDAGAEAKAAHSRLNDAHRVRGRLLEAARLYAPFSDGRMLRLGEYGNSNHPAYVATLLQNEQAQLIAAAGDDAKAKAAINKQFRGLRRSLARKHAEYEAVVAKSGYPDASDAENAAYHRFLAADTNDLADAESPSQAWNALTVGAYTDKSNILTPDFDGWQVVAAPGDIGPTSRTSTIWDRQWPLRPDVVFEGGNHAHDGVNPSEAINDLQLISTYYRPNNRLFQHFGDTSAATALAANLAAQVMAARPQLWPETVRGLIVHSAEWTPAMRGHLDAAANQTQKTSLVRRYGWGVPHLSRALKSASNDATLMVEDALLPFRKDQSAIKTRDMHLHQLPWPKDELLDIGEQDVELRVTLSYFIEPNPGERGWTRRHRYASHSLRFEVKRALESVDNFRARINRAAEVEEDDMIAVGGGADNWVLGRRVRNGGSIHSDIWRGSAAELAERDAIGIYPISGWWKEKPNLQRWDRSARYALLVSIRAPNAEVDLYNAISSKLAIEIPAN